MTMHSPCTACSALEQARGILHCANELCAVLGKHMPRTACLAVNRISADINCRTLVCMMTQWAWICLHGV